MLKKTELYILIVILLISSTLSFSLLTRGHLWGDDFAAYLMQGQSLINATTDEFIQRNTFTIQESAPPPGPVAYPWGYPLLLAPVLTVFGLKLLALKLVSTVFYVFFLIVFHGLLRLRFSAAPALFLTGIFAFNPALLQAQDQILADIPFLFFSTLSLFLIEKFLRTDGTSPSKSSCLAIGAVIFAAYAIRSNGVLLLGALAIAQFPLLRAWREAHANLTVILLPYVVFGWLAVLQSLLLPNGQGSYFTHYSGLTPALVLGNAISYPQLPAEMFRGIPLGTMFSVLMELLFFIGLFSNPRKNAAFLAYILLILVTFITWPEWQGLRFIFPILPLIALIAAEGWQSSMEFISAHRKPAGQRIGAGLAGTLVALSLTVTAGLSWVNLQNGRVINGPFDPVSAEMFAFIREYTPPDSIVIFFKPRALRLLTDRDSFLTYTCKNFSKGNYIVFHEKQGESGQVGEPEACGNVDLKEVFNNQRFTVYQVTP